MNFGAGGQLTLNGPLDPDIQISGVVRLLRGRLGLFTTTFSLDPDAPNVAVFTPSLGLIPYLDIVLRTRVSDTLSAFGDGNRSSIYDWNTSGSFNNSSLTPNSFDQLQLVRVRLEVTGPADQLMDNIRLSSTPPLPEDRLLALIGGNSLIGLAGGRWSRRRHGGGPVPALSSGGKPDGTAGAAIDLRDLSGLCLADELRRGVQPFRSGSLAIGPGDRHRLGCVRALQRLGPGCSKPQ